MKNPVRQLREQGRQIAELQQQGQQMEILKETIAELEQEMVGWMDIAVGTGTEFSRGALKTICQNAFLYFIKNPLIRRAVVLQTNYVFGAGLNIEAEDEKVDTVIQDFLTENKAEIWTQQAWEEKENELQVYANLFFLIFPGPYGKVKIRTVQFDEIQAKITNPEDRKEPWFYVREYTVNGVSKRKIYRDWQHTTANAQDDEAIKQAGYDPKDIADEEAYIYHVAVNKFGKQLFGVSEVYAALDWAKAYKEFLENWSAIVKSYAKFAWQLTAKTKAGAQAAGAKVVGASTSGEFAKLAAMTDGHKLEPIKTAGATTSMDDARRLLLMVCAATGIYEHYFGDPSTGNLATSGTMERPMELKFQARQSLWVDIFNDICQYVIDQSIYYGALKGNAITGELDIDEETGEPRSRLIHVRFPDLLSHNIVERVTAIVSAATLNGQMMAGTIDIKTTTRLLLQALEQDNIDEMIDELFPEEPKEELPNGDEIPPTATEALKVIKNLRSEIEEIVKKNEQSITA